MRAESTIAATVWRPCNTFGESVPLFPILTLSPHIDKNACKLRRKSALTCKHWKKYLGNFLLVVGMMSERFFIYHWLSVSGRLKTHWPPHLLQALNGRINFVNGNNQTQRAFLSQLVRCATFPSFGRVGPDDLTISAIRAASVLDDFLFLKELFDEIVSK